EARRHSARAPLRLRLPVVRARRGAAGDIRAGRAPPRPAGGQSMNKRVQLLLLAAVFFLPLAVAWTWFFWFKDVRPGTVNHGDLVEPVVPLADMTLSQRGAAEPVAPFRDEWFVVILAPRDCGTDCERVLYVTRQVWIRLNKD